MKLPPGNEARFFPVLMESKEGVIVLVTNVTNSKKKKCTVVSCRDNSQNQIGESWIVSVPALKMYKIQPLGFSVTLSNQG